MDHMRISGTEPLTLTKKSSFNKMKIMSQKCRKKLKPKEMV